MNEMCWRVPRIDMHSFWQILELPACMKSGLSRGILGAFWVQGRQSDASSPIWNWDMKHWSWSPGLWFRQGAKGCQGELWCPWLWTGRMNKCSWGHHPHRCKMTKVCGKRTHLRAGLIDLELKTVTNASAGEPWMFPAKDSPYIAQWSTYIIPFHMDAT